MGILLRHSELSIVLVLLNKMVLRLSMLVLDEVVMMLHWVMLLLRIHDYLSLRLVMRGGITMLFPYILVIMR